MATLTLRNTTLVDQQIDDQGTFVPASGSLTVTDAVNLRGLGSSTVVRTKVSDGTFIVNDGSADLSVSDGLGYLGSLFSFAGFDAAPSSFMDSPYQPGRIKRQWAIQQNDGITSFINLGFLTVPTTNGGVSATNDSDGQWLNYLTSAIADRDGGWISSAFTQVQRQNQPVFDMLVKTGSVAGDIQNVRIWNGLFSGTPVAASMPAVQLAAFRYDTGVDGTAFWRCVTNDGGGVGTVTVTTIAIAANTSYKLRIDMTLSTSVRFYINDVLVATHTTTLPGSTQNLGHVENIRTLVAVAKNYKLSRVFMEHF